VATRGGQLEHAGNEGRRAKYVKDISGHVGEPNRKLRAGDDGIGLHRTGGQPGWTREWHFATRPLPSVQACTLPSR
jgi:hypothetical protein